MRKISHHVTKLMNVANLRFSCNYTTNSNNNWIQHKPYKNHEIRSPDVYAQTKMITALSGNSKLDEALQLFDEMPMRDTVCWNSMIKGCLDCEDLDTAIRLFDEMPDRSVVSWTTILNGFWRFGKVDMAERCFNEMPWKDVAVWNSMIHGYFGVSRVRDAVRVFYEMPCRNVISWTSMICGLDRHGKSCEALVYFREMVCTGIEPTPSTYCSVLASCANTLALCQGAQVHGHICKVGYSNDMYITCSLITLYATCKQAENACKVFYAELHKNVVVWTALITGYGLNCMHESALKVFNEMVKKGVLPNQYSFTSALNSCCELESLEKGRQVHGCAIQMGLRNDAYVGNSLVALYSGCGKISDAVFAFKSINAKNTVSFNSMITGIAHHGLGMSAFTVFGQMIRSKVEPDEITFTGLLSASIHSGRLQKGRLLFRHFNRYRCIDIKLEHFGCMVDILGRCGRLEEAEEFLSNMPIEANSTLWLSLLNSCKMHSDVDIAERATTRILDLEPNCSTAYILLSNLYASTGRWGDVSKTRAKMNQLGILKQPGCSWVTRKGFEA